MPPAPAPEAGPRLLPAPLAEQLALIIAHFTAAMTSGGATMLRTVDAWLLNNCEIAEMDYPLLNRTLALRTAMVQYAQVLDADYKLPWAEREAARLRAEKEIEALEEVLYDLRPSRVTKAMGLGW